jgi:hypothetical protein
MGAGFSSLVLGSGLVLTQALGACCRCPQPSATAPETSASVVAPPSGTLTPNAAAGVVAIKTCAGAMVPAADGLIDDLEDNNNQVSQVGGRGGYWWAAKDDKGSTIEPIGEMKMSEGGAHG